MLDRQAFYLLGPYPQFSQDFGSVFAVQRWRAPQDSALTVELDRLRHAMQIA